MKLLLAKNYDGRDPKGLMMSEKLDGQRAFWSGDQFLSRNGKIIEAPLFFVKDLPKFPLDGELFLGRKRFSECMGIAKRTYKSSKRNDDDWKLLKYWIFDAPNIKKPFQDRLKFLETYFNKNPCPYADILPHQICQGKQHLTNTLDSLCSEGAEGIMLREPSSLYEPKRSSTLLKVKKFLDTEALVIGHSKGTGRISHLMGKLHCQLPSGVNFDVGTGFSDQQRLHPPPINSIVTIKYQELSGSGKPRFPVFLRRRTDVSWQDILRQFRQDQTVKKNTSSSYKEKKDQDQDDDENENNYDDDNEQEDEKSTNTTNQHFSQKGLIPCRYGDSCYRSNPVHFAQFSHIKKQC